MAEFNVVLYQTYQLTLFLQLHNVNTFKFAKSRANYFRRFSNDSVCPIPGKYVGVRVVIPFACGFVTVWPAFWVTFLRVCHGGAVASVFRGHPVELIDNIVHLCVTVSDKPYQQMPSS